MARTVDAIRTAIKVSIRTYPSLDIFKFPEDGGSKVDPFNLFIDVVAIAIWTFEVFMDTLKAQLEDIAEKAISGNNQWLRSQMLLFQYGDVITMVNHVPTYVPVDDTKRIITQCAVKNVSGGVAVKIAKGATPPFQALTNTEMTAVRNYYYGASGQQGIGFAGVRASFVSRDPDRLYISAQVFFFGQYVDTTVKANVIVAITNFLSSFTDENFDGRILMIKLVDAIQTVPGVSYVKLLSVKGRDSATVFGSATTVDVQGFYDTVAGHVISEDTVGQTLADTISMQQA